MKIGWIGLGAMGTPMAARLHDANLEVSVYNRTESKAASLKETEKSGLGTLDMAAVYHYLEKGEH